MIIQVGTLALTQSGSVYTLSFIITMQSRLGKLLGEYHVFMSSILNTANHKATSEIYGKEINSGDDRGMEIILLVDCLKAPLSA